MNSKLTTLDELLCTSNGTLLWDHYEPET